MLSHFLMSLRFYFVYFRARLKWSAMFNKSFQFCNEVIGCDKKNIYIYIPVIDFSVELIPTLFHILSPSKLD